MKKIIFKSGLVAAAASCLMAGSVYADEEFPNMPKEVVSENGVVDIFLPDNSWNEIKYGGACAAFSNGDDMILFNHYAKGSDVKNVEPGEANELSYETIQTAENGVNVFYGFADKEEDLDQIKTAVGNARVDSSKIPADEQHEIVKEQYSVEANDFTGYVSADELNVRSEDGINVDAIGTLVYGDEVHVTGNVLLNGAFCGWYQIDFNGGKGYVSAEFVSKNKPVPGTAPVVNVSVVRADGTDEGTHFLHKEGGGWVDDHGDAFTAHDDGVTWTRQIDGTLWTSEDIPGPNPGPNPVVNVSITRADGTDEGTHFVHEEGGGWVDDCGDAFTAHDDGVTWTRQSDGTLWTSEEHPQPQPEPEPEPETEPAPNPETNPVVNVSITRADGTDEGTHFVHEEGGGWVDDCGDGFTDNGDGTWTRQSDGTLWQ